MISFLSASFFFLQLNISSLQAHFYEFNKFLNKFNNLPAMIFLSKTRINVNPHIKIDIPSYTFIHTPLTKAGGVGACISTLLNYSVNNRLSLNIQGCEDLWVNVDLSTYKHKFTYPVI